MQVLQVGEGRRGHGTCSWWLEVAAAAALLMPGLATGCCRSRRVRPSSAATHIVLGLLSRGLWGRGGGAAQGMLAYHRGACGEGEGGSMGYAGLSSRGLCVEGGGQQLAAS